MVPHDAKVELNAAGSPGPPHGNVPEFDDLVPIDEFVPAFLFHGPPDLPADFRKEVYRYMFIFELDHLPGLLGGGQGIAPIPEIGVDLGVVHQKGGRVGPVIPIGVQNHRFLGQHGLGMPLGDQKQQCGKEDCLHCASIGGLVRYIIKGPLFSANRSLEPSSILASRTWPCTFNPELVCPTLEKLPLPSLISSSPWLAS